MQTEYSAIGHWRGRFEEEPLRAWAEGLRRQLRAERVSLGLLFMAPPFFAHAAQCLELLRVHAHIPLLIGCSSSGLIADADEIEEEGGFVLGLFSLPGAELKALHFNQAQVEEWNGSAYWHAHTGLSPEQTNGWLVFADPFHLDSEAWLKQWNDAYTGIPVLGGLASGAASEQRAQVYLNGEACEEGAVALSVGGPVRLASVISQGCTPIGETWTITKVEHNLIHQIGNRPAYEVLLETFSNLTSAEQKKARGNLFVGLVINEYLDEFRRGDFLIRNLLGGDPKSGVLAVGALPRPGQTLQFQRRDAGAATEDLSALLKRTHQELSSATLYGGCLCCCNGRGRHLFGEPSHDAGLVQKELGPIGLTGFFCNGEIGPVGDRNFLHGYAASLALFYRP